MITGELTRITQLGFTQNMVLVKTCPDAQAPIDLLGSDSTSNLCPRQTVLVEARSRGAWCVVEARGQWLWLKTEVDG